MKFKNPFSIEQVKAELTYYPDSGLLYWKSPEDKNNPYKNKLAGAQDNRGYIRIVFHQENLLAHRIAWAMFYGEWPPKIIDHINGDRGDNRISNLRLATKSQNSINREVGSWSRQNKTGFRGVKQHPYKPNLYKSSIIRDSLYYEDGWFSSPEEAARAYDKKSVELFGEFAVLNFPTKENPRASSSIVWLNPRKAG